MTMTTTTMTTITRTDYLNEMNGRIEPIQLPRPVLWSVRRACTLQGEKTENYKRIKQFLLPKPEQNRRE